MDAETPATLEVAVIGCGPAGLVSAKTLLQHGVRNVAVFDETDSVGGLWNCDDRERPNVSSSGDVLTSSRPVYRACLRTNFWKDLSSFSDFPYGAKVDIFPDARTVRDYYQRYYEKFGLKSCVHLNRRVTKCFRDQGGAGDPPCWTIETLDTTPSGKNSDGETATKKIRIWKSRRLLVCNGHFRKAFVPDDIPGLENFSGRLLHSSAFRSPGDFANETVLIVGGYISACDICNHLVASGGCERVILSTRKWGGAHKFLLRHIQHDERLAIRPGIDRVTSQGHVKFQPIPKKQGYAALSSNVERPDVILFATGYRYHFPFLPSSKNHLSGPDGYQLKDLFKSMVSIHDPSSLAFIGITNANFSPAIVMEYQAQWYARCVVLDPPSKLLERIRKDHKPPEDLTQHALLWKFPGYCNSLAFDIGEHGYWTQIMCARLPLHFKSLVATGYRPLLLLKYSATAIGIGLVSAIIVYMNR